jgi:hypothetical protein
MNPNEKEITTVQEVNLNEVKSSEVNSVNEGMLLVFWVAILGWLIVFIRALKAVRAAQNKTAHSLNPADNFPCVTCQFFSNNAYLRCAVHPSVALTEKAINCPDYCRKISASE